MLSMAVPDPSNEMISFMDFNLSQSEHGTMIEQITEDQIDISGV